MVIKFVCAWVFHGVPRDCGMFSLCCVFSSLSVLFFVLKRSSVLGYVIVCFVIVLKWARGVWFASSHVWARSYTSAGLIANVTFTCVLMRQRKRWYGFFNFTRRKCIYVCWNWLRWLRFVLRFCTVTCIFF